MDEEKVMCNKVREIKGIRKYATKWDRLAGTAYYYLFVLSIGLHDNYNLEVDVRCLTVGT